MLHRVLRVCTNNARLQKPVRTPIAKYDAESTTEWRVEIWKVLLPEVPRYLLLGKGYGMNATEMFLISEALIRGQASSIDAAIMVGSYHNGPLTLIIPLGIFGLLAFLWFAGGSLVYLYKHYRSSPPDLRLVNTFLLAYFAMRLIYFLIFYGQFAEDLFIFTGVIGLSISINGGLKKEMAAPAPVLTESMA